MIIRHYRIRKMYIRKIEHRHRTYIVPRGHRDRLYLDQKIASKKASHLRFYERIEGLQLLLVLVHFVGEIVLNQIYLIEIRRYELNLDIKHETKSMNIRTGTFVLFLKIFGLNIGLNLLN
jgi:hypothetical protein